jgi:hypothetical protein
MILKAEELTPIKFYPYTSRVRKVIYSTDGNEFTKRFKRELIKQFQACGVKAYEDNKVVFEVETEYEYRLFFGFYDGRFAMALEVDKED